MNGAHKQSIEEQEKAKFSFSAVSYTHLTLPTKLEV